MPYHNQATIDLVQSRYKNEQGEPLILTGGQNEIFDIIAGRVHSRTQVITYTQYGKSMTTALAILTRITTFPEKWCIVAPSTKKARIIMGDVIDHIFDNDYTAAKFEISKGESSESIRRERSKDRLTFRISDGRIGEVFILSTENKKTKQVLDAMMGFGAPNVVIDESSLIDDDKYVGIKRMLGGSKDTFLLEIGNPFYRNHFFKTSRNPAYHHILIDYIQGIEEGRITPAFIEEMRADSKPQTFGVMYECKFPDSGVMDTKGYMPILTDKDLDRAYVTEMPLVGELRLSCDVAGGGKNKSVILLRGVNGAKILYRGDTRDTMVLIPMVVKFAEQYGVKPENIFIDVVGIGKGTYDRLVEVLGDRVNGVNVGIAPENEENFMNLRAQAYWRTMQWVNSGGKLIRDDGFEELLDIKYKTQSDRKIKIKTKAEMLKDDGVESPDVADSIMLTFTKAEVSAVTKEKGAPRAPTPPLSEFGG